MPTRRHTLAVAGAAVATSGCLGTFGDEGEDEAAAGGTAGASTDAAATGVRLEDLSVQNNDNAPHSVHLAVEADDEILHLDTYELDGGGDATSVEGGWTDTAGAYRVHARLDGEEVATADFTEDDLETDCVRVLVRIDDSGDLDIWSGGGC